MFKMQSNNSSRLYCVHNVPSNVDCSMCRTNEIDYDNRPLYVPSPKLSKAVDNSQFNLPDAFDVPNKQNLNNRTTNAEKLAQIKPNQGTIRVPRTSIMAQSNLSGPNMEPDRTFPGNFQNRAHRFTRSFGWKTKPEESPLAQMQPLPKLVKKPGLLEICLKSTSLDKFKFFFYKDLFQIFAGQPINFVSAVQEIQLTIVGNGPEQVKMKIISTSVGHRALCVRMIYSTFLILQSFIRRKLLILNFCCPSTLNYSTIRFNRLNVKRRRFQKFHQAQKRQVKKLLSQKIISYLISQSPMKAGIRLRQSSMKRAHIRLISRTEAKTCEKGNRQDPVERLRTKAREENQEEDIDDRRIVRKENPMCRRRVQKRNQDVHEINQEQNVNVLFKMSPLVSMTETIDYRVLCQIL